MIKKSLRAYITLREGRLVVAAVAAVRIRISTHAPAGGATFHQGANKHARIIFLLTPLREGRPSPTLAAAQKLFISTHAPAGGATRSSRTGGGRRTNFYSRPCGRGDALKAAADAADDEFLLTPLREGRPGEAPC